MKFGGRHGDWQEAEQAIRDILFLYVDLTDYYGIIGDHDTGTFQPWKFLDCSLDEGYGNAETEQLLHQGAAVALLSEMIDCWEQRGGSRTEIDSYRAAITTGRFDHLPTARAAVVAGLDGEEAMIPYLDAVYEDYVLGSDAFGIQAQHLMRAPLPRRRHRPALFATAGQARRPVDVPPGSGSGAGAGGAGLRSAAT